MQALRQIIEDDVDSNLLASKRSELNAELVAMENEAKAAGYPPLYGDLVKHIEEFARFVEAEQAAGGSAYYGEIF